MNESIREVLRYLTGSGNIESISLDYLQKLADDNPYFPVAQFLLTKKLKTENNDALLQQAQKTALYFSNPYWLHYQLTNEHEQEAVLEAAKSSENEKAIPEYNENNKDNNVITDEQNNYDDLTTENRDLPTAFMEAPANEIEANPVSRTSASDVTEELKANRVLETNQGEEEIAAITRDTTPTTEEFLHEAVTPEETFVRDNIEQVILETQIPATVDTNEVVEEMAGASREPDETTDLFLQAAESSLEGPTGEDTSGHSQQNKIPEPEPDEHERMFRNIKAMLDATSEEAEADVDDGVIPIDPYYTIDYFASQGIKLELEQNPKDELGKHLRKFTDWLKHMKKLGPEDATEVIERSDTEADIQKIAETSNTVREVVTEAMAAVLEKQGKNDKAIELYKKLSFLYPHKSAYFADKIKNLKAI
jgi:hypothetical protein